MHSITCNVCGIIIMDFWYYIIICLFIFCVVNRNSNFKHLHNLCTWWCFHMVVTYATYYCVLIQVIDQVSFFYNIRYLCDHARR